MMKGSVVALLFAAVAIAQPQASTGSWADLSKLASGTEILVSFSATPLRGSLQTVTEDSLAINTAKRQEMLSRVQIRRVQSRRKGRRRRNALIGLGIGAGGGLAVGAAVDSSNHTAWFPNFGKAVFTPLGAIIGTVVGLALPSGGWHEIYRVP